MSNTRVVATDGKLVESSVDPAQALTASKALLAYIKKTETDSQILSGKRNLLDVDANGEGPSMTVAETPIWLTITTKRHVEDTRRLQPVKITVPHPLNADDNATICLITADPQRAYKNLIASEAFPAALRERITRVIDLEHLTKKFKAYEAQRKLFAEHDIFLGDERIINRLPQALGKTFYKSTAKRPIPVMLRAQRPRGADGKRVKAAKKAKASKKSEASDDDKARAVEEATASARTPAQIAEEIELAVGSAVAHLAPTTNTAIKVGRAGWPAEYVAANVEAVARAFVRKHVPQRWANVKAIFLKGPETMALPVWETDELWLDGKDVLKDGSEAATTFEAKMAARREKANVGKKRKVLADGERASALEASSGVKSSKKVKTGQEDGKVEEKSAKKAKKQPESNDTGLDKKIAEHKEKLKKQKKAAKKAMDI